MDQHSILDHNSSPQATDADPHGGSNVSVMATPAAATATLAAESTLHFQADERRRTLAQIAQRDLDAALQLLVERAQYITGATGAAIALRRNGHHDLLCRASAGSNAPSLGTLLSAETGLSGESVRARLALRCDDAERDPRVNREGCRELGIASVAVIPIVSDDQVLGVFELFSGKVNAFDERDVSALQRLGEMVETAVKLVYAEPPPEVRELDLVTKTPAEALGEAATEAEEPTLDLKPAVSLPLETEPFPALETPVAPHPVAPGSTALVPTAAVPTPPVPSVQPSAERVPPAEIPAGTAPATPRQLFWTAAATAQSATVKPEPDQSHVPPVLRNLHKCRACGFPVSEGRLLCVECEEKRWRGQLRTPPSESSNAAPSGVSTTAGPALIAVKTSEAVSGIAPTQAADTGAPLLKAPASISAPGSATGSGPPSTGKSGHPMAQQPSSMSSHKIPAPLLFSAGSVPSESWLSKNKYMLGAVVLVAIVVLAIAFLH
jgi:hypothetical protein